MPISVRINANQMSRDDYDNMIHELEESGSSDPEGRVSHEARYGEKGVQIDETWETREQFQLHQEERLAALQAAGLDAGSVDVSELRGPP